MRCLAQVETLNRIETLNLIMSELENIEILLQNGQIDEKLYQFLIQLDKRLSMKDEQIAELKNEVALLKNKVNSLEQYSSKDCIILKNLPLVSGKDITTDVIYFLQRVLGIKVEKTDLKACHQLGPITDVKRPPPIIAKFIFFDMKNRIWMRKKLLRGFVNPLNRQSVFLYERLTQHDKDLVDLAEKKGCRVITNNCQPQLLVENKNGKFIPQSISCPKDIDELLCLRNVAKQAPGGQNDLTGPGTKSDGGQKDPAGAKNHGAQNCSNGIAPIQVPETTTDTSSTKTPANKRPPPDMSPLADTAVIEQLRVLQHDKLKLMDYVESLLINHQSKTKQRFFTII